MILASSNDHKVEEFQVLFKDSLEIEKADKIEVIEDGTSFFENAHLKAKAYFEKYKKPVLSDDSGLCLEAFPLILGIHSARYKPELASYTDKCIALIDHYKNEEVNNFNSHFSCVLCLYISEKEVYFFEGISEGKISQTLRGHQGFGYDPLFIPTHHPEQKSFSEDSEWKFENGHRAKAVQELKKFLKEARLS